MEAGPTILLILIVIIFLGYLFLRHRAKKKALREEYGRVPSHTELYFEEYFENMIEDWDLLSKNKAGEWSENMNNRLDNVSEKVKRLKSRRHDIDGNLDKIEDRVDDLESEWHKEV